MYVTAILIEMIEDWGVDEGENLQTSHLNEPPYYQLFSPDPSIYYTKLAFTILGSTSKTGVWNERYNYLHERTPPQSVRVPPAQISLL